MTISKSHLATPYTHQVTYSRLHMHCIRSGYTLSNNIFNLAYKLVGFINPGSLGGTGFHAKAQPKSLKNNRAKGWPSSRPEGLAQEERHPLVNFFGPPIRPEHSLHAPAASERPLRSEGLPRALLPTPTRVSPTGVRKNTASYSDLVSPTGDPIGTLFTALLRLARPGLTGAIRPGTPARKEPGANGESSTQSQTMIPGPYPARPREQCFTTTLTQTVL
jgi:hypothetical protein